MGSWSFKLLPKNIKAFGKNNNSNSNIKLKEMRIITPTFYSIANTKIHIKKILQSKGTYIKLQRFFVLIDRISWITKKERFNNFNFILVNN